MDGFICLLMAPGPLRASSPRCYGNRGVPCWLCWHVNNTCPIIALSDQPETGASDNPKSLPADAKMSL